MYFVMVNDSINTTVCTTYHKEYAEWIAKMYELTYGEHCIIRWAGRKSD
jgi:hypothetical protein